MATLQVDNILNSAGTGAPAFPQGLALDGSTSGVLSLSAAATTTSYSVTLPAAQGAANSVLTNNGSGILSWAANSQTQSNEAVNLGLSCSVGSSALTISLTQADGASAPSTGSPVVIGFRSTPGTSGAFGLVTITSSVSITVPSGATLGQTSAVNQYVWVYAMNNAGTVSLGVSGVSLFDNNTIQSSTAISGSSTSGSVLYSTSALSNVPIRLIGRLLVNQTVAGTWTAVPTDVVLLPTPYPNITNATPFTMVITGSSSNPTVPTTNVQKGEWWRNGDRMRLVWSLSFTNNSGGSNGSGTYLFAIPGGYSIDSNKQLVNSNNVSPQYGVGYWQNYNGSNLYNGIVVPYNSTQLALYVVGVSSSPTPPQIASSGGNVLFTDAQGNMTLTADFPILGWSTFGP